MTLTPALAQNSAEGSAAPPASPTPPTEVAPPADKPADTESSPVDAAAAAGNAAEAGADGTAGPATPGADTTTAAGNAAEAGPAAPVSSSAGQPGATAGPVTGPVSSTGPPSGSLPALPSPGAASATGAANSAESRLAGGTSTNFAEGWDTTAEPPEPDYKLPAPADVAGDSRGYKPPEIHLAVPGIDPLPELAGEDAFQRPGREYLEQRPLPPLDETETDEERMARNIEESLKRIDLTKETRPAADTQLPTANGSVTFRAADAFQFDRRRRVMTFTGNAEILFSGMLVAADFIEVNDGAATAYAKGYVMVMQNDEVIYADEAYLNYDTLQLELFYVEGNTGGTRLSNGVVYFTADRAHGTFDNLIMDHAEVTTCDPYCGEVDEVHLSAKKVIYKRDRSIVLHDVHPYVRSHKVGWIPVLAFPLIRSKPRFEPEESDIHQNYGWTNAEGWFAKFAYTYYTHYVEKAQVELKGVVKAEVVQNLGVGLGVRQDFYIPALGVTTARAFYQRDWPEAIAKDLLGRKQVNGNKNFDFSLEQELNLSRALRGSFKIDRVNRFEPPVTVGSSGRRLDSWNNVFNLSYTEGDTTASLSANQTINTSGGLPRSDGTTEPRIQTSNSSANFTLTQQVSDELKFNLAQQYTSNKGGGAAAGVPANQEGNFDTGLDFTGKTGTPLEGYRAQLTYKEQGIDYDQDRNTTDNNVQINKELPKLRIEFPRDLINDGAYFNDFDMSFANLVSGRRRLPQSSFAVNLHAGGSDDWVFSKASRLNSRTDLNQYFYDDGNAQYTIGQTTNYTYDPRTTWKFSLNHNLTYRQGVREPPVSGDRKTYNQTVSANFSMGNRRSWRWQLQGGYNFAQARWNSITSNFNWDPNRTTRLLYNTSYDPENRDWGLSTVQSSWVSPYVDERGVYNWVFNASADVDTNYWDDWKLSQIRATYFRRYERGWSAEVTGGYRVGGRGDHPPDFNDWGSAEDFLRGMVKSVTLRKVNCCTTLEASWNAPQHEYQLKFYLNALPQYPGSTNIDRFQKRAETGAAPDRYLYQPQFLFPTDALRNDILNDLFGIQARF